VSGGRGGDGEEGEEQSQGDGQECRGNELRGAGRTIRVCKVHGFLLSDDDLSLSEWNFVFAVRPESAVWCCAKSRSLTSLGMTINLPDDKKISG
jgi:hypothetical protein